MVQLLTVVLCSVDGTVVDCVMLRSVDNTDEQREVYCTGDFVSAF